MGHTPNYDNPPVGEVALSVQFDALSNIQVAHLGVFWQMVRARFPKTESYPPIAPVIERFQGTSPSPPQFRVELANVMMPPRVWFISESGNELIQVQRDRFIFNWRKVKDADKYPRYEHVRGRFLEEISIFNQFLSNEKLGKMTPNQCEVTYVNQIISGTSWVRHSDIEKVLRLWSQDSVCDHLPKCEGANLAVRYAIEYDDGKSRKQIGRLHVDVQPAFRITDNKPIFAMNLTARGLPFSQDIDGILKFFNLGREHIVWGFTELTTDVVHKEWGYHDSTRASN